MNYKTKISDSEILKHLLKFYLLTDFFSLLDFIFGGSFKHFHAVENISGTLFIAPIFETLLVQFPLIAGLSKLRLKPLFIILITGIIFALLHIFDGGILRVIWLFYPLTMMTWCFYFFYTRCNWVIAFFTTAIVHTVYNLTALYCQTIY
jgi:hypothetical protein